MGELCIQKKFKKKFFTLLRFLRSSFPLFLLSGSHPHLITGRPFFWKSSYLVCFPPLNLPVGTVAEVISGGDEIVVDHPRRDLRLFPCLGTVISLLDLNPFSLLVIEEVGSPPPLASDFHVFFEGNGPQPISPVHFFHDGSIGIRSITCRKSQD